MNQKLIKAVQRNPVLERNLAEAIQYAKAKCRSHYYNVDFYVEKETYAVQVGLVLDEYSTYSEEETFGDYWNEEFNLVAEYDNEDFLTLSAWVIKKSLHDEFQNEYDLEKVAYNNLILEYVQG